MIDYSKSYGYPRSCTLCGGGTYGHGICTECSTNMRVGRVVKTVAGSFRIKDGQFQSRVNGAARFSDADVSAFDCTCDSCAPDDDDTQEAPMTKFHDCPVCSINIRVGQPCPHCFDGVPTVDLMLDMEEAPMTTEEARDILRERVNTLRAQVFAGGRAPWQAPLDLVQAWQEAQAAYRAYNATFPAPTRYAPADAPHATTRDVSAHNGYNPTGCAHWAEVLNFDDTEDFIPYDSVDAYLAHDLDFGRYS